MLLTCLPIFRSVSPQLLAAAQLCKWQAGHKFLAIAQLCDVDTNSVAEEKAVHGAAYIWSEMQRKCVALVYVVHWLWLGVSLHFFSQIRVQDWFKHA